MAKQVKDISQMSYQEIEEHLKQRKIQQAKLLEERGLEAKKDVEDYVQKKYGLTLAQVWMAGRNVKSVIYKNPDTGVQYIYSGRGKVPAWLKGADGKPNAAYEVK